MRTEQEIRAHVRDLRKIIDLTGDPPSDAADSAIGAWAALRWVLGEPGSYGKGVDGLRHSLAADGKRKE